MISRYVVSVIAWEKISVRENFGERNGWQIWQIIQIYQFLSPPQMSGLLSA